MKKSLLFLFFLASFLLANDLDELYKQAKEYEKNDEFKKAMEVYKQISNLQKDELKDERFEKLELENLNKFSNLKHKFYEEYLEKNSDKVTSNNIKKLITKNFGLLPYQKNYLLPATYDFNDKSDRKNFETKFQLSIEKPFKYNLLGLKEVISFGYTQTSYWQTTKDSSPFRESNYQPEVFITFPYEKSSTLKAYKIGIIHESNGQDKEKSRSWNRLYAQGFFQFSSLFFSPKVWYRLKEDSSTDDNHDIHNYLGYGSLNFLYAYKKHNFELKLKNNLRLDTDNKGSVMLGWTFPLPKWLNIKDTYGYLQYFNGYGESLIDYNKNSNKIGFGIAFSR